MRRIVHYCCVAGVILMMARPAEAAGPVRKFARGVANLATGWLEFPFQIAQTTEADGNIAGMTLGVARGVQWTLMRTLIGAVETVTFFAPNYPTREHAGVSYEPFLTPEFVTFRPYDKFRQ